MQNEEQDPPDGTSARAEKAGNRAGEKDRSYARKIMFELKAFKEVLKNVEQLSKKAGHLCIFLSRYHPELKSTTREW